MHHWSLFSGPFYGASEHNTRRKVTSQYDRQFQAQREGKLHFCWHRKGASVLPVFSPLGHMPVTKFENVFKNNFRAFRTENRESWWTSRNCPGQRKWMRATLWSKMESYSWACWTKDITVQRRMGSCIPVTRYVFCQDCCTNVALYVVYHGRIVTPIFIRVFRLLSALWRARGRKATHKFSQTFHVFSATSRLYYGSRRHFVQWLGTQFHSKAKRYCRRSSFILIVNLVNLFLWAQSPIQLSASKVKFVVLLLQADRVRKDIMKEGAKLGDEAAAKALDLELDSADLSKKLQEAHFRSDGTGLRDLDLCMKGSMDKMQKRIKEWDIIAEQFYM